MSRTIASQKLDQMTERQKSLAFFTLITALVLEIVDVTIINTALPAAGEYSAALCCNLYNRRTKNVQGNGKGDRQPNIASRNGESFVTAITNGTVIGFKYFNFKKPVCISVTVRNANGKMNIKIGDKAVGAISLSQSTEWKTFSVKIDSEEKTDALYLVYRGKGKADFLKMELR